MSTPLDGLAATITAAMPPARHRLDKIGARWVWLYPIDAIDTAAEVAALCADLVAHGATGIVPQQSARAIAWARQDYPRAGGSPSSRVRASVQLYRRSVADHVSLLLAEGETGSVWLWDWREADASARVALRVVHELEVRGHRGARAVLDYQRVTPTLTPDGAVGPKACAALGVDVPQGVVWRQS